MRLLYNNDDSFSLASPVVVLDTVAPKIAASGSPLLFSPNGDSNKDTMTISQNSAPGDDWIGRIKNASGTVVRTWSWKTEAKSFVWDGKGPRPARSFATESTVMRYGPPTRRATPAPPS